MQFLIPWPVYKYICLNQAAWVWYGAKRMPPPTLLHPYNALHPHRICICQLLMTTCLFFCGFPRALNNFFYSGPMMLH